jgi:hypothetical protein
MSKPSAELYRGAYYRLGIVADPAPEIIFDKERLAHFKVEILKHEITEMKNQIKLAEMYIGMIKEQYKMH